MTQRLPDHTPATLGDVRNVPVPTLATLLEQAEERCGPCGGVGVRYFHLERDHEQTCGHCHGTGQLLTADGVDLLAFLGRHGVRNDFADDVESRREFDDAGRDALASEEADEWFDEEGNRA